MAEGKWIKCAWKKTNTLHRFLIGMKANNYYLIIINYWKYFCSKEDKALPSSRLPHFLPEQRLVWINEIYRDEERVEGAVYEGLTIDFCKKIGAQFILRGIRYVSDFEYEKTIADANRTMDKSIETIFLTGEPKYTSVASTIVRDIIRNNGDASHFLPEVVFNSLKK